MMYALMDSVKGYLYWVRHFFRKLFCKDYIPKVYSSPVCRRKSGYNGYCEWWTCPKRKGGDTE